ncbi:MAG: GmrSD restriction endonuclease domain-containing protein [Thermotogota bacterium]
MSSNTFTFCKLIEEHRIEIPIIQRDYAMGRDNTKAADIRYNFIKQIKDSLSDECNSLHLNFVYGKINGEKNAEQKKRNKEAVETLLDAVKSYSSNLDLNINVEIKDEETSEKSAPQTSFIPLDGQQRLTTLFLLHWYILKRIGNDNTVPPFNFTYSIRPSSKDFCEALIKNDFSIDIKEKSLSAQIKDTTWFFKYWDKDPTVEGMLIMLDEIHEQFRGADKVNCENYWEKLSNGKSISFELLSLDDLELTDDLYIKMNARGKALTDYENFKAWLINYINDIKIAIIIKDWKTKIDTEWADLFWDYKDDKNFLIDEEYMRFFRNMFQIFYVRKADVKPKEKTDLAKVQQGHAADLATTKGEDGEYRFVPNSFFQELGVLNEENLNELFFIIDLLSDKENGIANYTEIIKDIDFFNSDKDLNKRDIFKAFVTGGMTYPDKVRFYAFVKYLLKEKESEEFPKQGFFRWMRVCRNLVENSTVDSIERFESAIKEIDRLIAVEDNNIYKYLIGSDKPVNFFDTYQINEERTKANLIIAEPTWEDLFLKYENHNYFKGKINFIIELAKNKNNVNNEISQKDFTSYADKCSEIFTIKMNDSNNLSLELALLAQKDYLSEVNSNKSFMRMVSPSGRANQDWRTRFLRDNEKSIPILKEVLETVDLSNINKSLDDFVDSKKENITDWRIYFIDCPEAISFCNQRLIRYYDDSHIRLLGSSATSHYHAELRSYWLYKKLLEKEPLIAPFKEIKYHQVRTISQYPCAVIDGWEYNQNNYAIDIRFEDEQFEIHFFNTETDDFQSEIVEILKNKKMTLSGKNNDSFYLIKRKEDSDIIYFLEELCAELKKFE